MNAKTRFPHVSMIASARGGRGIFFWPIPGVMYGLDWGGGPYQTSGKRGSRIRTIKFLGLLLMYVDVRGIGGAY